MAWIRNSNPPPNRKLEFNLEDFTGGLNNRSSVIEDNQCANILNIRYTYNNALEKRNGFKPLNSYVNANPITYVSEFKPYVDVDQLVVASNNQITFDFTTSYAIAGEVDSVNFQGLHFYCDGVDLFVYGKFPQVGDTFTIIIGTPVATNTRMKVVDPPAGYTPLNASFTRGKTVYDYTAGTVHYEPCENELNDPYKGANLQPENPKFIQVHKNRLFVSGDHKDDDNVYITDSGNPYYFAVGLPIQLPPNSDKVRGMTIYDDAVMVGREFDMYKIQGDTNNPELGFPLFELRRINTHTGVANNHCFDVAHNYLFFLGSDGIAYALATTRMDERLVGTQIISQSVDIFSAPISAMQSDVLNARTVFDNEHWYVQIGDNTLVYSYRIRSWTMYDYVDMNAPFYWKDKLIWGRKDGKVVEWSNDFLDDGRPIFCTWHSKSFDFGSSVRYKQFKEFFLVTHAFDYNDTDVRITFNIDYSDVNVATTVENKLSIWGKAKFGDRFINRNINASVPSVIGRRARYMRVIVSNGYRVNNTVALPIDLLDIPEKYNYMGAYVTSESRYYYYFQGTWYPLTAEEVNQPMRVYKVNGEYEMKGKR